MTYSEDLSRMSGVDIGEAIASRRLTSVEATSWFLERIEEARSLNAFVRVDSEDALEQAREADAAISGGDVRSPLAGVPIAIKDNISTKGIETSCGSGILKGYVPPYDATVIRRLKECNLVVIGKANMDEFAMGSSTETSVYGATRNPWDTERVPGGSSGGSAAAVAAGLSPLALGSDTGGSIRLPASYCGVVGLKPTYGAVSRYGLIAYASSLDQIGPLATTVQDCALLMNVIGGHDPCDSTSAKDSESDYARSIASVEPSDAVIGVPKEFFGEGIDDAVREQVASVIEALAEKGAKVVEVSVPNLQYALETYYVIAPSEASSNLARYDGVRYGHRAVEAPDSVSMFMRTRDEGFGLEVKRRIIVGTYALSAGYYDQYYKKALMVRQLIRQDMDRALQECDVLITPTSPSPAFRLGEKTDDPISMYMTDICTVTANLAGIPAISVPCGLIDGLPIGVQIMGRHFDEARLLGLAECIQRLCPAAGMPRYGASHGGKD